MSAASVPVDEAPRAPVKRVPKLIWGMVALIALLAIAAAFFEWNWLRGPLSSYVGARLGRPVAIDGDLTVELAARPRLVAESVTVANMPGSGEPEMARVERVELRVEPMSLLRGPVALSELTLVEPHLLLERDADGRGNWPVAGPAEVPLVDRLVIENGVVRYVHADAATDVTLHVATSGESASAEMPVHFSGSGRLRRQPVQVDGEAASLLALEDGERPYRLSAKILAGDTRARFDGTVVPHRLDNLDGSLILQGRDLSQLYPIVPVPFPWTPPYRLSGRLKHVGKVWTFRDFTGKVGDSDLGGRFEVDVSKAKPFADADLVSSRLDYKDLGGLVGLPPASGPPGARTAAQNKEAAKRERSERALPTRPYEVDKFRAVDARVRFKGKRFLASTLPLDNMNATLELQRRRAHASSRSTSASPAAMSLLRSRSTRGPT